MRGWPVWQSQSQPKKLDRLYLAPWGCVWGGAVELCECGGHLVCFGGLAASG